MNYPKLYDYVDYDKESISGKSTAIEINNCVFYFSYITLIAFKIKGKLFVHENVWSVSTGKHLDCIDGGDKENRLTAKQFKEVFFENLGGQTPSL
jgi:hypothetical protein